MPKAPMRPGYKSSQIWVNGLLGQWDGGSRSLPSYVAGLPGRLPDAFPYYGQDRGSKWQEACAAPGEASGGPFRSLACSRSLRVRGVGAHSPGPRAGRGGSPRSHRTDASLLRECSPAAPRGHALGRQGRDGVGDRVRRARADDNARGPQPRRGRAAGHKPHFRRLPTLPRDGPAPKGARAARRPCPSVPCSQRSGPWIQ